MCNDYRTSPWEEIGVSVHEMAAIESAFEGWGYRIEKDYPEFAALGRDIRDRYTI